MHRYDSFPSLRLRLLIRFNRPALVLLQRMDLVRRELDSGSSISAYLVTLYANGVLALTECCE